MAADSQTNPTSTIACWTRICCGPHTPVTQQLWVHRFSDGSGASGSTAATCNRQWVCAPGFTVETDTAEGSTTAWSAPHRRLHAQARKVRACSDRLVFV